MRSGPPAGTSGYFHETALYDSDRELLDIVVPFLQGGLDAGEPTIVTFAERNAQLVIDAMGPACGVRFLPGADQYARPASAISSYQQMFGGFVCEGAEQIRVVGDVPHPGTGGSWRDWARYEVVVNQAYDPFPIWGLCPYDTRTTPEPVLADVLAAHPHVATPDGGHAANPRFDADHALLHRLPDPEPDPVEGRAPDVVLAEPAPSDARRAAASCARAAGLGEADLANLEVTISELVTNAMLHGTPPHVVELWVEPGRVVTAVSDAGPGIADPCAGLVKGDRPDGGLGLWIAHQVCTDLVLRRHDAGFTARATVGRLPG